MTLARRTLTRAPATLSCLLGGLLMLIAGLSPHVTAAVRDLPTTPAHAPHTLQQPGSPAATPGHDDTRANTGPVAGPVAGPVVGPVVGAVVGAAGAERADAGESCQDHDPVQGPPHASHLRLRGTVTDNRPLPGPDCVVPPHLDGHLTLAVARPHGFDARPRCLTRRTAAQISALLQVFRC